MNHRSALISLSLLLTACGGEPVALDGGTNGQVGPVPSTLRQSLDLDPFYEKHLAVEGLPILGSADVSDEALLEAAWIVRRMLAAGKPGLLSEMAGNKVRLAVMAATEYTTDIPEHAHLEPALYWDRRARGLGATPDVPAASAAEENLLGFSNDPYENENILIHEFAHAIHGTGLNTLDPTFDERLRAAYENALSLGRWDTVYAGTNPDEYWAEGVQSWFDDNRENDAQHNHVNTRTELEEYDPELAALCAEVFGRGDWRYRNPSERAPANRVHLAGFDLERAPSFRWREVPLVDRPIVDVDTHLGRIKIELDFVAAPITTRNFLRYAHEGHYSNGEFFRTVTHSNQPDDRIKIAVIQAQADPSQEEFAPIEIERTRDTGLRHLDGTISMARDQPNSATHSFFICIGDQPELDFGGRRNPDGQGFAAFGRVIEGMEVVREIHRVPAEGQTVVSPVKIKHLIRVH